ncbi:hypothetical protein CY34DRAFT_7546 [Suillus luteus UH-Slu-Lm8-n1]|uniref:Mitochondrial carrier n=1 Tax=Suillus luteus UH-Slu-Lm8-n1 TaxID=930992 RepID=A0A0D0BI16_9AGAM|nr:hypothetical protein CY34DRAFT_7546 [Suillus luteus UH-Slu-Lm8-n1]
MTRDRDSSSILYRIAFENPYFLSSSSFWLQLRLRPAFRDTDWQRHETGLLVWSSKKSYEWNEPANKSLVQQGWFQRRFEAYVQRKTYIDLAITLLLGNKPVVCALSASYISTFVGYPLDSLKSRLQTTKTRMPVLKLAGIVYREEGVTGFYRGLWIPLVTISFVRAASFTIYSSTKEYCRKNNYFTGDRASDAALAGGLSGALSGSLISFTSAPFELVKVFSLGQLVWEGVLPSLLTVRDTAGTALYFFEYDAMRHLLGRQRSGEQGPTPAWLPIPTSLIPFVCGSLAGVTSWALIYPLDVVKTKVQQRALAGTPPKGVWETLRRLVRGPDPKDPKPVLAGIARIYRGLGVSAVRSITTHGLLWTFFDITSHYIDHLP